MGDEDMLRSRGVEVKVLQDPTCVDLMQRFIASRPELWNEDIGRLVRNAKRDEPLVLKLAAKECFHQAR